MHFIIIIITTTTEHTKLNRPWCVRWIRNSGRRGLQLQHINRRLRFQVSSTVSSWCPTWWLTRITASVWQSVQSCQRATGLRDTPTGLTVKCRTSRTNCVQPSYTWTTAIQTWSKINRRKTFFRRASLQSIQ